MKPIMQTSFSPPSGNCHAACVASILEIGLNDVPSFYDTKRAWYFVFTDWMIDSFDLYPVDLNLKEAETGYTWVPRGYYIVSGPSPRSPGILHSCVGCDGLIAHDPFPGGNGVLVQETATIFVRIFE